MTTNFRRVLVAERLNLTEAELVATIIEWRGENAANSWRRIAESITLFSGVEVSHDTVKRWAIDNTTDATELAAAEAGE